MSNLQKLVQKIFSISVELFRSLLDVEMRPFLLRWPLAYTTGGYSFQMT